MCKKGQERILNLSWDKSAEQFKCILENIVKQDNRMKDL